MIGDKEKELDDFIDSFSNNQRQAKYLEKSELLCECFSISLPEIKTYIENSTIPCLEAGDVMSFFKIGEGCGSCKSSMKNWIEQYINLEFKSF